MLMLLFISFRIGRVEIFGELVWFWKGFGNRLKVLCIEILEFLDLDWVIKVVKFCISEVLVELLVVIGVYVVVNMLEDVLRM